MRNPNGFGSVVKLKGKRRKPFRVQKTNGYNDKGQPILLIVGYAATREEGMILLSKFNNEPWDVQNDKLTFSDVYNLFVKYKMSSFSIGSQRCMKTAYHWCEPIFNIRYKDLRSFHMQECIDKCPRSVSSKGGIKTLFYHLDRFAMERDIIAKSYSFLISAGAIPETNRTPFTMDQISMVWDFYYIHQELPFGMILILLYTGFRINELLSLKISDVDFTASTLKGGLKTRAGKDRVIPIHSDILPIVKSYYNANNFYLFPWHNSAAFYPLWHQMMDLLQIKKTPHECRHTFESMLDDANANRKCIDLLMGHTSKSVGLRVYTHKTLDDLRATINLLKLKNPTTEAVGLSTK